MKTKKLLEISLATCSDREKIYKLRHEVYDEELMQPFIEAKYGNNYINIQATIEHAYYHLGQIVLIKKLLNA